MDKPDYLVFYVTPGDFVLPAASSTSSASSIAFGKTVVVHPQPPDSGLHPTEPRISVRPEYTTPTLQTVGDHHLGLPIEYIITAASVAVIAAWHIRRSLLER